MPNEHLRSLVKTFYKTRDGEPLLLSDGQLQIYEAVIATCSPRGSWESDRSPMVQRKSGKEWATRPMLVSGNGIGKTRLAYRSRLSRWQRLQHNLHCCLNLYVPLTGPRNFVLPGPCWTRTSFRAMLSAMTGHIGNRRTYYRSKPPRKAAWRLADPTWRGISWQRGDIE
jgi:hypothetical protein